MDADLYHRLERVIISVAAQVHKPIITCHFTMSVSNINSILWDLDSLTLYDLTLKEKFNISYGLH